MSTRRILARSLGEYVYRAATSRAGRLATSALGACVRMPFGERRLRHKRSSRLLFVVTVDTEGGYVARGERRIWQGQEPLSFEGYVHGIRNVRAVLDHHGVKGTFLVSPHGLSARGSTLDAVERALESIPLGGHQVGLHIHPTSDRAISARLGTSFAEGSAQYLQLAEIRQLVRAGRELLLEGVHGVPPLEAFRWGNWGLDARAAQIVAEEGFSVDSSATPGLMDASFPTRPRFDWKWRTSSDPWELAPGLVEIPIATWRLGTRLYRADPLYGALVAAALQRHLEFGARLFVLMTHSTEATYRDGAPTPALAELDELLAFARSIPEVDIVTLGQARRRLARDGRTYFELADAPEDFLEETPVGRHQSPQTNPEKSSKAANKSDWT